MSVLKHGDYPTITLSGQISAGDEDKFLNVLASVPNRSDGSVVLSSQAGDAFSVHLSEAALRIRKSLVGGEPEPLQRLKAHHCLVGT